MASRDRILITNALAVLILSGCAAEPRVTGTEQAAGLTEAPAADATLASPAAAFAGGTSTEDAADLDPTRVRVLVRPPALTDDVLVCRKEARTGSHHRREVCRTRAQMEAERRSSQLWMRSGGRDGSPIIAR